MKSLPTTAQRVSQRDRARFQGIEEIALACQEVGGTGRATERMGLLRLNCAWGQVVGAPLKSVTRAASYHDGRLTIEVKDTAWKREVERLTPVILAKLSALLSAPAVREIAYRLPAAEPPRRGTGPVASRNQAAPGRVPADSDGGDSLSHRLDRVMERYLALRAHQPASGGVYR